MECTTEFRQHVTGKRTGSVPCLARLYALGLVPDEQWIVYQPPIAIGFESQTWWNGRQQHPSLVVESQFMPCRRAGRLYGVSKQDAHSSHAPLADQMAAGVGAEATLDFCADCPGLSRDMQADGRGHRGRRFDSAMSRRSALAPSGSAGISTGAVRNRRRRPAGAIPKYRYSAYTSVANQDLPVLPGPTNTVNGRNSTDARAIGPKSVTSSVNGRQVGNGSRVLLRVRTVRKKAVLAASSGGVSADAPRARGGRYGGTPSRSRWTAPRTICAAPTPSRTCGAPPGRYRRRRRRRSASASCSALRRTPRGRARAGHSRRPPCRSRRAGESRRQSR